MNIWGLHLGLRGLFEPPSVTDFWSSRWRNGGFPFRTPINVCRANNTSSKRKANTSRNRQISVRGAWGTENVPNGSWVPVMAVPGSWQQGSKSGSSRPPSYRQGHRGLPSLGGPLPPRAELLKGSSTAILSVLSRNRKLEPWGTKPASGTQNEGKKHFTWPGARSHWDLRLYPQGARPGSWYQSLKKGGLKCKAGNQAELDPCQLMSLDGTTTSEKVAKLQGETLTGKGQGCLRGERSVGSQFNKRWQTGQNLFSGLKFSSLN